MIKAIETNYGGYRFRSRLEARWAVFFDELGWSWEYEKEGYVLDDNSCYLPDFYLPQLKTYVEVKPDSVTDKDINKCKLLSYGLGSDFNVILVNGLPSPVKYPIFYCGEWLCGATLTTYIRAKGWDAPYFNGDWWAQDNAAFEKAKTARFEFK